MRLYLLSGGRHRVAGPGSVTVPRAWTCVSCAGTRMTVGPPCPASTRWTSAAALWGLHGGPCVRHALSLSPWHARACDPRGWALPAGTACQASPAIKVCGAWRIGRGHNTGKAWRWESSGLAPWVRALGTTQWAASSAPVRGGGGFTLHAQERTCTGTCPPLPLGGGGGVGTCRDGP